MHVAIKKLILVLSICCYIEDKFMTVGYRLLFFGFVFFLLNSCGGSAELSSTGSPEGQEDDVLSDPTNEGSFYTITNDFQDHHNAAPVYLYLSSVNTGKAYVVPPTKYNSVELEFVIIDMKVEEECIKIPKEAFPISVGVCQSSECTSVRPLNVILKNPAHYNIGGIGGLLTPQILPVSPCSKEYIDLVGSIEEYQTL